jgi:hypothetical protein
MRAAAVPEALIESFVYLPPAMQRVDPGVIEVQSTTATSFHAWDQLDPSLVALPVGAT